MERNCCSAVNKATAASAADLADHCRWNRAPAAGSSALGSAPDDAVASLHSNLLLPHASLLMHSCSPPGSRYNCVDLDESCCLAFV